MDVFAPGVERLVPYASNDGVLERLGPYVGGRRSKRDRHVYMGKGALVYPDGTVEWQDEEWMPNALADEGEASMINVYLREQAHPTKFLALLNDSGIVETDTMATMIESNTPGSNGYNRQAFTAGGGDWGAPSLDTGDHQSTASQKTFGPATATWTITHAAFVTTSTGTAGLFLGYIATTTTTVGNTVSYLYTAKWKLQ
jgi:hypothetical protein